MWTLVILDIEELILRLGFVILCLIHLLLNDIAKIRLNTGYCVEMIGRIPEGVLLAINMYLYR